jgi:hypothetical protein
MKVGVNSYQFPWLCVMQSSKHDKEQILVCVNKQNWD